MAGTRYSVFFAPRNGPTTYGTEIDVSDFILFNGVALIKKSIDSGDYDVGVFVYDDLQLKAVNRDGYFNEETDIRSIFPFGRDRAKVRVVFTDTATGDTIVYRGLLNEEATRLDATGDQITFRILARDSVIRDTKISGGTISNGMSCKNAILAIIDVPMVTSVLTVSAVNINPDFNFTIDDGSKFNNKSGREMLNKLLFASNSVMLISDVGVVTVQSRDEDTTIDILNLFGPFNINYRQNTIRMTAYNTGKHRMFNAVRINDTERSNAAFISVFGYRQKKFDLDFITTLATEQAIADRLVDEFKAPKIELNIEVPTSVARNSKLLDRVSLDWSLRIKPIEGKFLPIIGVTAIGDANAPLPYTFGSLAISTTTGFKIIEITENPNDFESILKLRQIGTGLSDGVFNSAFNCIIGYAVIGLAPICGTGDTCETYNPSVIGAAQIGCTEVAA